jgi:hypothetical protein
MDFDDMPDSYFAFLSNQRKLPEPDKINGAMRDLGRGSEPESSKGGKVRSRASQPSLASKPSVPSLPPMQRTSGFPGAHPMVPPGAARGYPQPPQAVRPQLGGKPPTSPLSRPHIAPMGHMGHPNPNPMGHVHPGHMAHPQMAHPMTHPGAMGHGHGHGHHGGQHPMPHQMGQPVSTAMPSGPYGFSGQGMPSPAAAPPRSNALVFVLIVILIAAIAVLAYLVMTKQ